MTIMHCKTVTMMSFYVMTAVSDVGMLNYRYDKMSSWVL